VLVGPLVLLAVAMPTQYAVSSKFSAQHPDGRVI